MTVDSASAGTVQCMPVRAADRAQTRSSPASANPLAIFCYQMFFDYDPSSAASLHLGLAPPNPDMAVCGKWLPNSRQGKYARHGSCVMVDEEIR